MWIWIWIWQATYSVSDGSHRALKTSEASRALGSSTAASARALGDNRNVFSLDLGRTHLETDRPGDTGWSWWTRVTLETQGRT